MADFKLLKKQVAIVIYIVSLLFLSCSNETERAQTDKSKVEALKEEKPECSCSFDDAHRFIYSYVTSFNREQNLVDSQYAKRLSVEDVEKRPDCSYIAKIAIETTISTLTNSEPKRIEKRIKCDGVEFYFE